MRRSMGKRRMRYKQLTRVGEAWGLKDAPKMNEEKGQRKRRGGRRSHLRGQREGRRIIDKSQA